MESESLPPWPPISTRSLPSVSTTINPMQPTVGMAPGERRARSRCSMGYIRINCTPPTRCILPWLTASQDKPCSNGARISPSNPRFLLPCSVILLDPSSLASLLSLPTQMRGLMAPESVPVYSVLSSLFVWPRRLPYAVAAIEVETNLSTSP